MSKSTRNTRGKSKKVPFNQATFKVVLKLKKKSIIDIEKNADICSEKTVRRSLKAGEINPLLLDKIAEYLDDCRKDLYRFHY